MNIEFVTHASFIIEHDGIRVINDPWLFGPAFLNGWDLLCDYRFEMDRFKDISYIWFSHEHPDHFSPPVIKQIPEPYRESITVLFQETKDKKVIQFCDKAGFKTRELKNHQIYPLSDRFRIQCCNVPFFDSWICYYLDDKKILNVNDCIVDGEGKAEEIKKQTGEVDVLLTQFSYAAWKGNIDDRAIRRASAANKLEIVRTQTRVFRPAFTIPFASFVYFSHVENSYMNDGINKPEDACAAIHEAGSQPVVLYPQDVWEIGTPWDNARSLARYREDYDGIGDKPLRQAGQSVPPDELLEAGKKYVQRIKSKNNLWMIRLAKAVPGLGFFKPFRIYVHDLDRCYEFAIERGLTELAEKQPYDVSMHSESLAYVFNFDWGYDTLTVNGRFQAEMDAFAVMTKSFSIGPLNNTGRYITPSLLLDVGYWMAFLKALTGFVRRMKKVKAG